MRERAIIPMSPRELDEWNSFRLPFPSTQALLAERLAAWYQMIRLLYAVCVCMKAMLVKTSICARLMSSENLFSRRLYRSVCALFLSTAAKRVSFSTHFWRSRLPFCPPPSPLWCLSSSDFSVAPPSVLLFVVVRRHTSSCHRPICCHN